MMWYFERVEIAGKDNGPDDQPERSARWNALLLLPALDKCLCVCLSSCKLVGTLQKRGGSCRPLLLAMLSCGNINFWQCRVSWHPSGKVWALAGPCFLSWPAVAMPFANRGPEGIIGVGQKYNKALSTGNENGAVILIPPAHSGAERLRVLQPLLLAGVGAVMDLLSTCASHMT
eukprot:1154731-Pelagomonas_calceolata.AAC.5